MNFYGVGGLLVRRRTPVRQGIALEIWSGKHWLEYTDVDAVLRDGLPLTEGQALHLIREARDRTRSALTDDEARKVLRALGKVGLT